MRLTSITDRLRRNLGLRLIALLLAIGLWLFVNTGQHQAQTSLQVPVSYRGLPADLMLVGEHPDFVELQITGPRTLLSLLDPARLALRLDLNGVGPGQAAFKITPEMFNVPRQTSITRIDPAQVMLDIDRIVNRELPVHLTLDGVAAPGFQVASIDLKPAAVEVRGPSRAVSRLDRIDTLPFDVAGASADVSNDVALVGPGDMVSLRTDRVDATVKIAETLSDREFKSIAIQVRDTDRKFRINPAQATVTVRGPARKVSSLSLDGAVYISARDASPGTHDVAVQVDLPDGIQLVSEAPQTVKLRMYTAKAASRS